MNRKDRILNNMLASIKFVFLIFGIILQVVSVFVNLETMTRGFVVSGSLVLLSLFFVLFFVGPSFVFGREKENEQILKNEE